MKRVLTTLAIAALAAGAVRAEETPVKNWKDTAQFSFLDANGNGLHDADEGFVGGVTLTVAQGSAIIGQAVSTGTESPICFSNLPAGTYQVAQTLPATLEMTMIMPRRSISDESAACVQSRAPKKFTAITRRMTSDRVCAKALR